MALGCNALHIVKSENGHQLHVYYQGRKTEHFKNQLRLGGLLLDVSDILGLKIYFVCLTAYREIYLLGSRTARNFFLLQPLFIILLSEIAFEKILSESQSRNWGEINYKLGLICVNLSSSMGLSQLARYILRFLDD